MIGGRTNGQQSPGNGSGVIIASGVAGVVVATVTITLGFALGFLPLGAQKLTDPCVTADAARLAPEAPRRFGYARRTGATCEMSADPDSASGYAKLSIELHRDGPQERAEAEYRRGCTALGALGTVRRPSGVGDGACAATEDGRLRVSTVVAYKGAVWITVRYATQAKDAAAVERDALEAARRIAASL